MENLPFANEELDMIWAEGSIYNIGFERGVSSWRRFLKPGGILAVSEITWLTKHRPPEIRTYWQDAYPGIDMASSKIDVLEKNGYSLLGYFVLPEYCWMQNYYDPLQKRFDEFMKRNQYSHEAQSIIDSEIREIELYKTFKEYFGYGFYIAEKCD
jgi:SAM-dependent methyltransferase